MRVHFIAIGGAVMHNLAIALKNKGFIVTGSDDSINEPSLSRLSKHSLLPEQEGWYTEKISGEIDAVILGMHARENNPELLKAQELGIAIYSFPEFIARESKNKLKVVIGGSHGKTTITSMVMHVLKYHKHKFDYMVGSQLQGFDTMVEIKDEHDVTILEGDEYLSSPIDRRPKFHLYNADIGLISGIAWDHINVFPTFEGYVDQFRQFAERIPSSGHLIYCMDDEILNKMILSSNIVAKLHPYTLPKHNVFNGRTSWITDNEEIELSVFGDHNLRNLEGARIVLSLIGVQEREFLQAIPEFAGAARRLEKVCDKDNRIVYRDFAHSPSKLKATVDAVRKQYPAHEITAVMELHTFSSLNKEFLSEYKGSMMKADHRLVFFDPQTVSHKKLPFIDQHEIRRGFSDDALAVIETKEKLIDYLKQRSEKPGVFIMMSSGNFSGMQLDDVFPN